MELTVGEVLEGKVTGIAKFGAFVALEGGRSGLVHISEVANTFVSDVNEYLEVGQTVKVKVIGIRTWTLRTDSRSSCRSLTAELPTIACTPSAASAPAGSEYGKNDCTGGRSHFYISTALMLILCI